MSVERHSRSDHDQRQNEILAEKLAALQTELGRMRQEFRRSRIITHVIEELYRLANQQATIDELGELLVALLTKTLGVDSVALLRWENERFIAVHGLGLPVGWTLAMPLVEVPAHCDSQETEPVALLFASCLNQTITLQHWIWACHRRAGLALLLGDALDSGLNRIRFDADDQRIVETALAVFVTLHHLDHTETALRHSETSYQALFDGATDALAVLDPDSGKILEANRQTYAVFNLPDSSALEQRGLENWLLKRTNDALDKLREQRTQALAGDSPAGEYQFRGITGETFWAELRLKRIAMGGRTRLLAVLRDVSERKKAEERLMYHAFHDALTGLPNRTMILSKLQKSLDYRARRQEMAGLLFLDLNRFKVINDSLGHAIGDRMLKAIGQRLHDCLRSCDTVARLGGDEFLILLEYLRQPGDVLICAERIHQGLIKPFFIDDHEIHTRASIGIALNQGGYQRAEDMLRDADIALHQAKVRGKDSPYVLFDPSMHDQVVKTMQLERDLRRALERREFVVFYQPIIHLPTGRLKGFEALVRWRHPERGMVSPNDFIPLAEETLLILPIGWQVLTEVCHQLGLWSRAYRHRMPVTVSVNLSSKQLIGAHLAEDIHRLLEETGCDPALLELEITESMLIDNTDTARTLLNRLRELHIRLSLDDFGTGYSSLSYLHQFPFDTIKIDRAFLLRINEDVSGVEIVRAIVALARALGKTVTAEGLETSEQVEQLKMLGCDFGQGYYFSRPVEVAAAERWLSENAFLLNAKPA